MKRFTRIFGILSGIGAVVWLVRDRLISLTAQREPEPPQFRAAPAAPGGSEPSATTTDDLKLVKGIGPVYERGLHAVGVESFSDLADVDADAIADQLGVSTSQVDDWRSQAADLSGP
jgi:predicted flap endonuclease-1-like 5' DNA nuclease